MALNQISTATNGSPADTKIYRRALKLNEAKTKRQAVGTPGYRPLHNISVTHSAYVNGTGGATLKSLSGSAGPAVGHPWSTGTVATYGAEFRSYIGGFPDGTPGDIITTCNEGDIIWFDFYGSGISDSPDAYIQFSGANITNQDAQSLIPNLVDPYPFNVYQEVGPDLPPAPAFGAPIGINADNLTEGNETLTVTWYLNSTTIVTATSITIVDTSVTPITTLLSLDAGNVASYAPQHVSTVASLSNGGTALHIPKAFDANIGNQVSAGYPVTTSWGGYNSTVTSVTTGTGSFGEEWVISIQRDVSIGFAGGNPVTFGNSSTWIDTVSNIPFTLYGSPTYSASNGGYLTFVPGSSQYAQSSAGPGLLTKWTVETWHYYDGTNGAGNPCLLSERFTAGQINYCMGSVDGNFQTGFFNGGWHLTPVYTLTPNNWYHLVGTYDGTDIKLYLNGTLIETTNAPGQTVGASNSGINLMRRWDNLDLWGGRLAVVRIYNGAIGQSLVTSNFNAEKSRYGL